jgi:hypothetical protein
VIIDDLDRHLPAAGSIDRAALPLGMYLAWCGNLHLLAAAFQQAHEGALLRLRYRELTPAEFLTATSGGTISSTDLTEEGQQFSEACYDLYLEDFQKTFGGDGYSAKDDWAHYDQIAPLLTRRFMSRRQEKEQRSGGRRADERAAGDRKWWQVWR